MECAAVLVRQKGFAALSARNLAQEAGVSPGTIYNYFRDTHELILLLNEETIRQLTGKLVEAEGKGEGGPALLVGAYFDFMAANRARSRMLFEYHPPPGCKFPPSYKQAIEEAFERVGAVLSRHTGSADAQANRDLTLGLWAMLHGLSVLEQQGRLGRIAGRRSLRAVALSALSRVLGTSGSGGQ